ncbi:MAG: hypothetical protein IPK64_07945 [bacterium]|nr:hypothetical protein [bacterium]
MKRCRAILFLLLAISLVAVPVLPPAANAVPNSDAATGSTIDPAAVANGGSGEDEGSGRGDPGGAGDGLGADLPTPATGTAQYGGSNAMLEIMLQLLRLMQAAG